MDVGLVNDGPVSDDTPSTPRLGVDFTSLDEAVQNKPSLVSHKCSRIFADDEIGHD